MLQKVIRGTGVVANQSVGVSWVSWGVLVRDGVYVLQV